MNTSNISLAHGLSTASSHLVRALAAGAFALAGCGAPSDADSSLDETPTREVSAIDDEHEVPPPRVWEDLGVRAPFDGVFSEPWTLFNDRTFRTDVKGAVAGRNAAVLPSVFVRSEVDMLRQVRFAMAAATRVDLKDLTLKRYYCGRPDEPDCAARFKTLTAMWDAPLAAALYPYARQLRGATEHLSLYVWTPMSGNYPLPGAVTLQGIRADHLLGLVVFQ